MENTLLNLIPAAYLPEIHLSQYDVGRTITFTLKDGASDYSVPSGASVKVKATKPSGFGFEVACTFNGGTVTLVTTDTMTPESGRFPAELSIVSGNTTIGTSNFIFNIERSPHPEGTIDGDAESLLPELTLLVERIEAAADSVDEDTQTVTEAKAEVLQAKADTLQAKADTLSARDESVSAKDLAVSSAETSVEASQRAEQLVGSVETKADAIVKTASGEIASFTDGGDDLPMKSLKVNIVPKQSGSGDPSPSNVRPISGYEGVNVNVCGVNVWDEEWENGDINIANGETRADSSRIRSKNFISVKPNTSYYAFWGGAQYNGLYVCFYDINKNWVSADRYSGWNYIENGTFTTPSWCYYMKFYNNGTSYGNNISINYPATDTSYHIGANNESYPISLGQTVYGGTLEVMSGKLTIDKALVDLGSLTYTHIALSNNRHGFATPTIADLKAEENMSVPINAISSMYKAVSYSGTWANGQMSYNGNVGNKTIVFINNDYTDATAFKNAMNGQSVVYELATPIEVTLTPTQVKTLLGDNNIFADSGSVEAEYRADTTLAYNELLSLIASLS